MATAEPALIEKAKLLLERYIRAVFNVDYLPNLMQDGAGKKNESIRNLTVKSAIEANLHGRAFLHSHTVIRVEYQGKLRINMDAIKKTLYRLFEGITRPYVNIKGVPDSAWNFQNYVRNENREAEFMQII